MKTWVFSVTIHLILVITIAEIGLCRPHYGQTTPTKFRNYQPNVQMVQRCLRALNRGNLGIKPKYLCQALIKTFLLEQKAINTNQNLNKLNHLDINKNNKESNVADCCNRKPNRKAPKEEEARAIPVRTEAVARPRGAYYYSPEAQEWIRIKFWSGYFSRK